MSVSKKQWIKDRVTTSVVAGVAVTLFCLVAVSSRYFSNCLAPVVADIKTAPRDISTWQARHISSSNICTVDVFRNYYKTINYFPGDGHWDSRTRRRGNVSSTSYRFVPDLCKFRFDGFQPLPGVNVRRCLRRRNVTRIMVVGDSNAARYYAALLSTMNDRDSGGWKCNIVTSEANDHTMLIPDVRYFSRRDRRLLPLLRATVRHCSSCVSRVDRCRRQTPDQDSVTGIGTENSNDDTLWLEHVSMVSVLDSSLKIDVPHNHFVVNLRYRADTFQVN